MQNQNILRKDYTVNSKEQQLKIPMEVEVCIPADDPVRLISQFVEEMDLTALLELEQITTTEVFIDGTKIEASANKYTFVWKKSVTKHQARLLQKTALLVGEIIERYQNFYS